MNWQYHWEKYTPGKSGIYTGQLQIVQWSTVLNWWRNMCLEYMFYFINAYFPWILDCIGECSSTRYCWAEGCSKSAVCLINDTSIKSWLIGIYHGVVFDWRIDSTRMYILNPTWYLYIKDFVVNCVILCYPIISEIKYLWF